MTAEDDDAGWMRQALDLARAQLGTTAPNPSVGCVLVLDGRAVGEGATGSGGRPHAEEIALQSAGARAQRATAYVSLEPCSGRSSGADSCSELLIKAGVKRVVIGCTDPNPQAREGQRVLQGAGIDVTMGVLGEEAERLNRGFFKRLECGRPLLAIAPSPTGFDAEYDLQRGETFEGALDRMGAAGLTRVWVRHGSPLAAQLSARGLVDETIEPK